MVLFRSVNFISKNSRIFKNLVKKKKKKTENSIPSTNLNQLIKKNTFVVNESEKKKEEKSLLV